MSSGNAVFTEVLQVSVDSSAFAAQMAEVEQIYNASLAKMQASAQEFDGFSQVGQQVQGATGYIEQFGAAFEKALVRVPARLAVMTLIAAAIGAVVEPIRLLNEGMDNLENHSDAFHTLSEEIKDFATHIESVAAVPLFDGLLSGMEEFKSFIAGNKATIDGLATAFGQFLSVAIKPFFSIFTENKELVTGFFQALGLGLTSVVTIADLLLIAFKTVFGLIGSVFTALGKIDVIDGPMKFFASLKAAGADFWDSYVKKAETSVDQTYQLLDKSGQLMANILGIEQTKAPNVPIPDHRTLADMKAEFAEKLAELKANEDKKKEVIQQAVADRVLSHQAAAPKIVSILNEEQKHVNALVAEYKNLATNAKDANGAHSDAVVKTQDSFQKTGTTTDDSIGKAKLAAERAASAERIADAKIASAAMLKIDDDNAKAEIALIKKAVSEGRMTREAGVDADIANEQRRHTAAMSEIAGRDGAPGTEAAAQRSAALAEELNRSTNAQNALTEAHAEAVRQDADALEKFNVAQLNAMIAAKEGNAAEAETIGNRRQHAALLKQIIQLKQAEVELELKAAQDKRSSDAAGSPEDMRDAALISQLQVKIAQLQKQLSHTNYSDDAVGRRQYASDNGGVPSAADNMGKALGLNFDDLSKDMTNADTVLQQFVIGITAGVTALASMTQAAGQFYETMKKSGLGSAIGGAMGNSHVDDALASGAQSLGDSLGGSAGSALSAISNEMPMIGPAISSVMSVVTNLFSTSIQNMVNDINQQVSAINEQAQTKQIGIQQQIAELQAEEQSAISQLGGKKKAQSQLNSILQSLNTQIENLKFQAAQTVQQFNDMATAGGLGNMTGVMASWAATWQQINQQVEQYIQAGGSMSTAAEYMNQQLQQQRQTLQDQVNQGDATAINDAIQLNNLLTQRVQMMKQEAATEFGLENGDSLERNTASAVQIGTQLTQQRQQYALQLQQTNSQIALDTGRVAAESKIFSIATNLAALQAQSNALNLYSLNEQLQKMQDMQTLLNSTNGLTFTPGSINPGNGLNGTQAPIPGEPSVAGPINFAAGAIVINGDVTEANATTLASQIASNLRSGRTALNTN
jgi:hypothetical protein